jgi:hypothetical protein
MESYEEARDKTHQTPKSAAAKIGIGRYEGKGVQLGEDMMATESRVGGLVPGELRGKTSEASLPPKERVDELRRQMRELGIDSLTVEGGASLLGLKVGISYTIKDSVERLSKAEPGDVQEIAASQIQLLSSYYTLVLDQAQRSFRWALIAAGIGFVFFFASVGTLLAQQSPNIALVSLVSGALIEVVSGIGFYLYNKSASQLAMFHTRLDSTQRFLLANSVCEGLEGDFKQQARSNLVRMIAGMAPIPPTENQDAQKRDGSA